MPYNQSRKNEVNNSLGDLIKGNQHTMHPTLAEAPRRKYLQSEIQKTKHNGVNTYEVTQKLTKTFPKYMYINIRTIHIKH